MYASCHAQRNLAPFLGALIIFFQVSSGARHTGAVDGAKVSDSAHYSQSGNA
jgi:hypothetical protein